MAAPGSEELRELERLLVIAGDSGEVASFAYLQEEMGVGAGQLTEMLAVLREHGKATEVEPGGWSSPEDGEVSVPAAAEPVRVHVEDEDSGESVAPTGGVLPGRPAVWQEARVGPTVRLTRAVVDALDAESVGKIVKAALVDGEVFMFEVEP